MLLFYDNLQFTNFYFNYTNYNMYSLYSNYLIYLNRNKKYYSSETFDLAHCIYD